MQAVVQVMAELGEKKVTVGLAQAVVQALEELAVEKVISTGPARTDQIPYRHCPDQQGCRWNKPHTTTSLDSQQRR